MSQSYVRSTDLSKVMSKHLSVSSLGVSGHICTSLWETQCVSLRPSPMHHARVINPTDLDNG